MEFFFLYTKIHVKVCKAFGNKKKIGAGGKEKRRSRVLIKERVNLHGRIESPAMGNQCKGRQLTPTILLWLVMLFTGSGASSRQKGGVE